MTGYDVARELRAAGSKAKIIAVTGWGRPEDVARSRAAGIDLHLMKPVSGARLVDALLAPTGGDFEIAKFEDDDAQRNKQRR